MNAWYGTDDGAWCRAGFTTLLVALIFSFARWIDIFELNNLFIVIPALISIGCMIVAIRILRKNMKAIDKMFLYIFGALGIFAFAVFLNGVFRWV